LHPQVKVAAMADFVEVVENFIIASAALDASETIFIGPFHPGAQGKKLVGASLLRHYLRDQILSRFLQSARSFSGLGIAHDDAVRRIRSFANDARERQGFRISPVGMPVVTLQK